MIMNLLLFIMFCIKIDPLSLDVKYCTMFFEINKQYANQKLVQFLKFIPSLELEIPSTRDRKQFP